MLPAELITLRNEFHSTEARIRVPDPGDRYHASRQTVLRIRKQLCPSTGCECGDTLGARGPQHHKGIRFRIMPVAVLNDWSVDFQLEWD